MLSQEEPIRVPQPDAPSESEAEETPQRNDTPSGERFEAFSGDEETEREEFGYEQLPMDDEFETDSKFASGDDDQELPPGERKEPMLPRPLEYSLKEAKIDEADLEVIRNVMNKIPIPAMAVPNWASQLPEELWLPRRVEN